jgi:hypothetical protein
VVYYSSEIGISIIRKTRPVETIPGMGVEWTKENDGGVNSTMIYCKNFCKCHSIPPVQELVKIIKDTKINLERISTM